MSDPAEKSSSATAIRPFRVEFPEKELAELRRRIAAKRWPARDLVADRSQGVQLPTLQERARYWKEQVVRAAGIRRFGGPVEVLALPGPADRGLMRS